MGNINSREGGGYLGHFHATSEGLVFVLEAFVLKCRSSYKWWVAYSECGGKQHCSGY